MERSWYLATISSGNCIQNLILGCQPLISDSHISLHLKYDAFNSNKSSLLQPRYVIWSIAVLPPVFPTFTQRSVVLPSTSCFLKIKKYKKCICLIFFTVYLYIIDISIFRIQRRNHHRTRLLALS